MKLLPNAFGALIVSIVTVVLSAFVTEDESMC
jgi:hypothetical protein